MGSWTTRDDFEKAVKMVERGGRELEEILVRHDGFFVGTRQASGRAGHLGQKKSQRRRVSRSVPYARGYSEWKEGIMRRMIATMGAVTTGALAGAMTLIRVVLVPFWRRSLDSEFKPWFVENAPRLRALMVPLGAVAASATTANAMITGRRRASLGAAAAAGVVVVTMAVNEPLNARFEGPEPVEPAGLERWVRWHDVRLALGLVAAWCSTGTADGSQS